MLGAEFLFSARGRRKRGRKVGLVEEVTKILGLQFFFIKGSPNKIRCWSLFYATFCFDAPRGPQGYPKAKGGENLSQNWGFLIEGTPSKIKF